jgi:hypothetical protein
LDVSAMVFSRFGARQPIGPARPAQVRPASSLGRSPVSGEDRALAARAIAAGD